MQTHRSGTYLVTTNTDRRRSIFQVERTALLFIETLQHYRREGRYLLHAFVVMPDHVHLLLTPNGLALERAVGLIKGGFSHGVGSKFPIWQTSYKDHRCRDAAEFIARRDYIHMNPVRAGIVTAPSLYPYSSAFKGEHGLSG